MNLLVSLKYLVALDDHKHFGRAALACHVTQPALSNALRALEAHYACAIVKRGRAFAGFTAEGERVLSSARQLLREQELLQQDLQGRVEAPCGQLLLGAVPTAMPVAARFVAMLQDRHPGIVPTLRSMSSVELETGLDSLALDLGLGYNERMDRSQLRVLPQYGEQYFLLRRRPEGPAGLHRGAAISWAEAGGLPLCLLSAEMHNRSIIDRAFASAGVQPRAAIESNSTVTLVSSVLAGRVCSILPGAWLALLPGQAALEARPLCAPLVEVPMAFMLHPGNRPSHTLAAALQLAQDPVWQDTLRQASFFLD
ncbi:LysR substrate-binding domain-containing protein [Paucibacter soli]|uniref:LysR substrate-binding domain-containing protein n=1 Tax=Paucibacter soli TaxID=3133433 RepID=UPI0030AB14B7